ncbi:MAG TPA: amidohydrolase family protein [Lentisphaeria bacterium]|nr:amidohydrolase family protein [Lentisphaeria bacterium]
MFDINTAIGHWPFRRLPRRSAGELRQYLHSYGVEGAAVASTPALFYMNSQDANLELAEEIAPHRDFFVGVATLNPGYAAAVRDLDACVEKLGFRALRLSPCYHNYNLADGTADALLARAGELGIPVLLPNEIVNYRQRHWMEPNQPLGMESVLAICARFPQVTFIGTEGGYSLSLTAPPNLCLEMSRYSSCYGQVLAGMVQKLGAERILFGSGAPFKEIEPSLLKLHHCQIPDAQKELIAGGNARRLLGL